MRRCYYCGKKKKDDAILCNNCEKELDERLKKRGMRNAAQLEGEIKKSKV